MAEHEHGTMDITTQEKTFDGFMKGTTYVGVISALVLIFLWITVV